METVNFEELSTNLSSILVFDVRNRDEVSEKGQIPGSHCIPVTEMGAALALSPAAFKVLYGFDKPEQDANIVTHCMMGGRAGKAVDTLKSNGFTNAKCYKGSFNDWLANNGEVIKPGKPYTSS